MKDWRFFYGGMLLALLWVLLIFISLNSCAPLGTTPFEPTKKVNVAEEQEKQSGRPVTRNRMDCYEFYKAELERCKESWDCPERTRKYLERKRDTYKLGFCRMRLGKFRW